MNILDIGIGKTALDIRRVSQQLDLGLTEYVAFVGLLDLYPARNAYSVIQLRRSATKCLRVRRSTDNAEMDIGFVGGIIDKVTLLAFCGAGSGYVSVLYNQMTNGTSGNCINVTAASQMRIVTDGVLNVLVNGVPTLAGDLNTKLLCTATDLYRNRSYTRTFICGNRPPGDFDSRPLFTATAGSSVSPGRFVINTGGAGGTRDDYYGYSYIPDNVLKASIAPAPGITKNSDILINIRNNSNPPSSGIDNGGGLLGVLDSRVYYKSGGVPTLLTSASTPAAAANTTDSNSAEISFPSASWKGGVSFNFHTLIVYVDSTYDANNTEIENFLRAALGLS